MLIDLSTATTDLVLSSQGRSGTPDGNIFVDTVNRRLELISVDELPTIDYGAGPEANRLSNLDGVTAQAIYAWTVFIRQTNETLRHWRPWSKGVFDAAGAFQLVDGWLLAENGPVSDWAKVRASGLSCLDSNGVVTRVYFGARSLTPITPAAQPYYQLVAPPLTDANLQAAAPIDFSRPGPVDEMLQVFGNNTTTDTGAGNFDDRSSILVLSVRTWGQRFGRVDSVNTGITELGAFGAGFGLGEQTDSANVFDLADVWTTPVAPFNGLSLEVVTPAVTKTGFISGTADYDILVHNTAGASLLEVRVWLDALSIHDTDSDVGVGSLLGKRANQLYTTDASGRVVTTEGMFIEGLTASDEQSVVQTDINGVGQEYPFNVGLEFEVGGAVNDPNAWWEVFLIEGGVDDYETPTAITLNDSDGNPMVGNVATDAIGTKIFRSFAIDSNTQGGFAPGASRDAIVLVEGNGVVTQASAVFTISKQPSIAVSVIPSAETNI